MFLLETIKQRTLFLDSGFYLVLCFLFICATTIFGDEQIAAFPGAYGPAARSIGGRHGKIIEVTNLNASGPGSFRAACQTNCKRIVVFRVAGIINIRKNIVIRHPYITIAGQTAPGGGILLRGNEIAIHTHDVVIRFLRIRTGKRNDFGHQEGDCFAIRDGGHDVIIDHCSASWSNDENIEIWSARNPAYNVTFSWNLIAEGLSYDHASCGLIVGSDVDSNGIRGIAIYNNFFTNCKNRMPLVKCHDAQIINNIMYNWSWWPTGISGGIRVDIIGNKYIPGPNSPKPIYASEVMVRRDWHGPQYGTAGSPSIYIAGNIGPHQADPNSNNWLMLMNNVRWRSTGKLPSRMSCGRDRPMSGLAFPMVIRNVDTIEDYIFDGVGASHRLDANGQWVSNRDAVDIRLIGECKSKIGQIPVDEDSVGGYPSIATGVPYADKDHDGMADAWESRFGFDPDDPTDASMDADDDGYTNIEEFLNGTSPKK